MTSKSNYLSELDVPHNWSRENMLIACLAIVHWPMNPHIDPTAIPTGMRRIDSYINANSIYHILQRISQTLCSPVYRTVGEKFTGDIMYPRELFASHGNSHVVW